MTFSIVQHHVLWDDDVSIVILDIFDHKGLLDLVPSFVVSFISGLVHFDDWSRIDKTPRVGMGLNLSRVLVIEVVIRWLNAIICEAQSKGIRSLPSLSSVFFV